jgi:hypothetical protein
MHNNLNRFLSALVVLLLPVCSMAQATPMAKPSPKEELSVKLSSPDKPFRLNIGLIEGNITVLTHAGKEIAVEAELNPEKKKPGQNANQNININTNTNNNLVTGVSALGQKKETTTVAGKYVTVTENDNTVRIGPVNTSSSINVTVKVPKSTVKLNLTVALSGGVSVKDITGELEVNNPNGSITLTNVSGSVVATSVNGNITVTFASVTENSPMAFSTLVGKIDVTFPPSFKANMKIQSDEGSLYSDFDILFEEKVKKLNRVNPPPLFLVRFTGKLSGKINGGSAEILMKNMMGNMYIRKSN